MRKMVRAGADQLSLLVALASLLSSSQPTLADATAPGQPVCLEQADLQEFVLAMIKKDVTWIKALKSCTALKGGLKMETIEDLPSDSDIGHVAHVRVFGNGNSFTGYTLIMNK